MALTWPADLQITMMRAHRPQHTERSGGVSLSGHEQSVLTGFGRFRFGVTVQVRTAVHWKALNRFLWRMAGNTVNVPLSYLNRRSGTASVENGPVAIGATELDLDVTGDPLVEGEYFSRNGRAYVIITTTGTSPQTLTIRPPIRETLGDGWAVLIAEPVCEMKLVNDEGGTIDLDVLQMGDTTLEFIQV